MLSINRRKFCVEIMWYDYIKVVKNLEKYTYIFSYWVRNQSRSDNHMQHNKNKIKIEKV